MLSRVLHGGAGPKAPRKLPSLSCFKCEAWKYVFCSEVGSFFATAGRAEGRATLSF